MPPAWIGLLFPDGTPVVHAATIQGRPYATHWLHDLGTAEGATHRLLCLAEIDPAAIGTGGARQHHRLTLDVDDDGAPLRCQVEIGETTTALRFDDDTVVVAFADGTRRTVPRGGAAMLASGNHPGLGMLHDAVLAAAGRDPAAAEAMLFVLETFAAVPVRNTPAPDLAAEPGMAWHRTSHGEIVRLDARARVIEIHVPKIGYRLEPMEPAPPLPDWHIGSLPASPRALYRRPKTDAFTSLDLTVTRASPPVGATLTVPTSSPPHPGLLFCAGSGTHDRHGMAGAIDIGTHELMDALAARGFAGLRYDKRGVGTTALGEEAFDRGLAAELADARACLAALRERPETGERGIAVIGHSLGGLLALALATGGDVAVDAVVLLATPGRRLDAISVAQIATHGGVMGYDPAQTAAQIADIREAVALVEAGAAWRPGFVPDHLLATFPTPTWLRDALAFDAPSLVARLRCPLLVCQGSADLQISPEDDFAALRRAAETAHVPHATRLYPGLDHLFKPAARTNAIAAYHEDRRVDPTFIADVGTWLAHVLALNA